MSPLVGQTTPGSILKTGRCATAWSYRSELSVRVAISLSENESRRSHVTTRLTAPALLWMGSAS